VEAGREICLALKGIELATNKIKTV